jgi:HSP20 family protein
MELSPWKPFGELKKLRSEMESLWDRFFGESTFPSMLSREWSPRIDVTETEDTLLLTAELPGLESKDVEVMLTDDVLSITGEKKKEKEEKDETHHFIERFEGSFKRSFRLPVEIQSEKVEAKFDKGVLKITLPKKETAKKKEIKIKVE